jgi:16S rRNA (cytosine967-C5)-methyltransferase
MHPKLQVQQATELLQRVLLLVNPADREVSAFFRENKALGAKDRAILAETTFRVLRQRLVLQHLAQSGQGPLARRLVLLAWQGSDAYLKAAVTEAEWTWLQQVRALKVASLPERVRANMPPWLLERLQSVLGASGEELWPFLGAMEEAAPLDLRVNTFKAKREAVLAEFESQGFLCAPTPHSPMGIRLQGKPALNRLEVFNRGDVEVQDEGSQLLALLTDAHRGEMVVDFCAGAGGKTLALGAAMRNTGRLYAFDTSGHRLAALKPRLARSGLSNVHPVQIAHERDDRIKRLAGKIDRVLVDAPCSGLGTLRRNPDLKWRQKPESVAELAALQLAILSSASRLLKPGGRLVYATCSILPEENESTVQAFLAAHPGFEAVDAAQELARLKVSEATSLCQGGHLRLWPHRHGTDGFFAAVIVRRP